MSWKNFWRNSPSGGTQYRRNPRSAKRAERNLGIIELDHGIESKHFRDPFLDRLDAYYENRQYEHLAPWDKTCDSADQYIPVRERKPRIRYPFAKLMMSRIVSMILGGRSFPKFKLPNDSEGEEFLKILVEASRLKYHLLEPIRRGLCTGSVFVRFWISAGKINVEWYHAKYCYPTFGLDGSLDSVVIKYVYVDKNDRNKDGEFRKKWFRMELNRESEILYNNPEYDDSGDEPDTEPDFEEVQRTDHGLGFVQGSWFRTEEKRNTPDGTGLIEDMTDFIDEMCYSMSQSSTAIGYNQDPLMFLKGMDEDEVNSLIRSSDKTLNLGREGEAGMIESSMTGVDSAMQFRDRISYHMQHAARIILMDPEKIVGSAQSGKALEILYGPMVDLVFELHPVIEPFIKELVLKIANATLYAVHALKLESPIMGLENFRPEITDFEFKWPPVFEETLEDTLKKINIAATAKNARMISTMTAILYIADEFNILDPVKEKEAIDAEPVHNPFGGF